MLWKNPATSALAVIALALGIGLTTGMYSIVHGLLNSRLPFAEPHRLVDVTSYDLASGPRGGFDSSQMSIHDFLDLQKQQTSFEGLVANTLESVNLNDEAGYPERYEAGSVTWDTFRVLGVEPVVGRGFTAEDGVPGAARVVLIGHDLWRHRSQGRESAVGGTIRVNGEPATIVGVMPPAIEFPLSTDLWLPLPTDVSDVARGEGGSVRVVGRLADGASLDVAQAEMTILGARLAEDFPETNTGLGVVVRDYRSSLNSETSNAVSGAMFAAVCLVLLIACANVASLLLARSSLRAKELAIRTALGARRRSVMGFLVFESLVLALLGSVLGLGLGYAGTTGFENAFSWQTQPYWVSFEMDSRVVLFVIAAGLTAGVVSGILPALKASGAVTFDLLKDENRGSSSGRLGRLSRVLVVAELALTCALLVVTGLMVRTVLNYHTSDLGFDTESIVTASLTLPEATYAEGSDAAAFYERLVDDLVSLSEVESAAVMSAPPGDFMGSSYYALEGESYANQADYPWAPRGIVSPEFFETYGIGLVEGRLFHRHDDADSPPVAIVNESFAAEIWPGESALGKRLRLETDAAQGDGDERWRSVVGVVPDAGVGLINPAFAGTTEAGFYVPEAQIGRRTMSVAVKTRGEPAAFAATLRQRLAALDPALPIDEERTMERVVWEQTFSTKVVTVIFSFFGAAALLLASVGIFGVLMFSVSQRTQEIGIRMALGARPYEVLRLVLRQGMGRLLIGIGLGLVLAWGLGSAIKMLLYGVRPLDPVSFLGTALVLVVVALTACFVPAWRASRVDPLVALHYE